MSIFKVNEQGLKVFTSKPQTIYARSNDNSIHYNNRRYYCPNVNMTESTSTLKTAKMPNKSVKVSDDEIRAIVMDPQTKTNKWLETWPHRVVNCARPLNNTLANTQTDTPTAQHSTVATHSSRPRGWLPEALTRPWGLTGSDTSSQLGSASLQVY